MDDLMLADELGSEFGRSAPLASRAAQEQRVAAVLDDRVRHRTAVGARHLADRLEAQETASAELAQPRERILEAVDLTERIELVDDEPQPLIPLVPSHRLEHREPHPRGDDRAERRDFACPVGEEEHPAGSPGAPRRAVPYPLADGEGRPFLARRVLEHADGGAGARAHRSEHLLVTLLEEGPGSGPGEEELELLDRGLGEQAVDLAVVRDAGRAHLAGDSDEEGAGVLAPGPV